MLDAHYEPIPPGLDAMPPGPALAGFLASIDVEAVSAHDRVVVLRAHQRMTSHFQAQSMSAIAAISDHMERELFSDDPALAWEASATEIRAALRLTRRSAEVELDLALAVRHRLPRLWDGLARGSVDVRRARVIVNGTSHLDEETARSVVDTLIGDAPQLTTGELAAKVRRLGIEVEPESATDRYKDAVEERRVIVEASPDGTAHLLGLNLPPDQVIEISRRIDRLAKTLRRAGDPRTIDQIRADIYLDLLAGRRRDAKGGTVDLHVDLDTLARLTETPGDLGGYGPVIADIARQLADTSPDAEWRYTVIDPNTGLPTGGGTTRRRPTASDRRTAQSRDQVCYFPGCRMPATQCDLDHRTPWAEVQRTSAAGLDAGCRHDHVTVRHRLGWKHQLLPNGDHLWTSPLGHQYTKSGRPP
jgi:hypothetical protein